MANLSQDALFKINYWKRNCADIHVRMKVVEHEEIEKKMKEDAIKKEKEKAEEAAKKEKEQKEKESKESKDKNKMMIKVRIKRKIQVKN